MGRGWVRARRDDYVRRGLDPLAFVVDAGEGVNGADHVWTVSLRDALGAIEDVAQRETKIAVANGKEIEGMCVPVDRAAFDAVGVPHRAGAEPVDEFFFDGVAFRMPADGAAGFVCGAVEPLPGWRCRGVALAGGAASFWYGARAFAWDRGRRLGWAQYGLDPAEERLQADELTAGDFLVGEKVWGVGTLLCGVGRFGRGVAACCAHCCNLLAAG
jgi:hypothetical protein